MKITLNKDELNKAIALYVREKCIANCNGWEISDIELTLSDEGESLVVVSVDATDPLKTSPMPCVPQMPVAAPAPKEW